MDDQISVEVLRLDRLEKRAQAYFKIGRTRSNLPRLIRAARLETAANSKIIKIITREIETYQAPLHA